MSKKAKIILQYFYFLLFLQIAILVAKMSQMQNTMVTCMKIHVIHLRSKFRIIKNTLCCILHKYMFSVCKGYYPCCLVYCNNDQTKLSFFVAKIRPTKRSQTSQNSKLTQKSKKKITKICKVILSMKIHIRQFR